MHCRRSLLMVFLTAAVAAVAAPPNDNFEDRLNLPWTEVYVYGSNTQATLEANEPFTFHVVATVWYTWTAPFSGSVRLSINSTAFDPIVHFMTGSSFEDLQVLEAVFSPGSLDLTVTAGTIYQIRVGSSAPVPFPEQGDFMLSILYNPPANDNFDQRTRLSGAAVTVAGINAGATEEPQEPPAFHELSSVWYSWVAPSNGSVHVTVNATNFASFFPLLRVYEGDYLPDLELVTFAFAGQTNRFETIAGREYQLKVAGAAATPFPRPEGAFTLDLWYGPSPNNDAFSNRVVLSGKDLRFPCSTIGATREAGEPAHGPDCRAHSIWYSWTAPDSGIANIAIDLGYYPFVFVYTGATLGSLNLVASNSFSFGTSCCISFPVISNTVYQIAFDACFGYTEEFAANLRLEQFPRLEMAQKAPQGSFQMRSRGYYYGKFTVEASANLVQWQPIFTNFYYDVSDKLLIEDPAATNHLRRFYRAVLGNW